MTLGIAVVTAEVLVGNADAAEIGVNEDLGYGSPSDLAESYPEFFWSKVEPYIRDGLRHLEMTTEGKQWIANLHSNIFQVEHRSRYLGPFQGN